MLLCLKLILYVCVWLQTFSLGSCVGRLGVSPGFDRSYMDSLLP